MADIIDIDVPGIGPVKLVDREQLRFKLHGRTLQAPAYLKGMAAPPKPPAVFDWSKNGAIKLPILGNDQWGDCYLAAALHQIQVWTGTTGAEAQFDVREVGQRYFQLSGGDNGLSDEQIYPAWKNGLLARNGPHKILDEMTIRPDDDESVDLAMWAFAGVLLTFSLPGAWRDQAGPGVTWKPTNSRSVGGHAVTLTGKNAKGGRDLNTWGIQPPINIMRDGLLSVDPEIIAVFSLEMFNAQGIAPCGLGYTELALLWTQLGGRGLPPSPFPPPSPTPPVGPPLNPYMIRFQTDTKAGVYPWGELSSDVAAGEYFILMGGDGPPPAVP